MVELRNQAIYQGKENRIKTVPKNEQNRGLHTPKGTPSKNKISRKT